MPKKKELPKKPKGRPYTSKHSKEVIDLAVEALKNKTVSSYEAEKIFGIPRRTLLDKLHNKHPNSPGCPTRLTDEEEANTIKVLIAAAEYGSPLTLLDLRIVVYRYLEANGRLMVFNNKLPGKKWAYSFVKRNKSKLTFRAVQNIKRSRAEKTSDELKDFFKNLQVSLEGVTSENILNYDETNLSDNPGTQKCLFRRGVKYPERVVNFTKGSISIMFAITAGGECLPPYVVYKADHLYTQWTLNGPKGARFNRSKSGWFDSHLFEDWFQTIILPWAKNKTGTKVLIGDNLASHINHNIVTICEQNNIRFVYLPPNSSHLTQPLDVCYFGPLKKLWREILLNYKLKNPRETTIHKGHFPDLLRRLMEKLNEKEHNIISAFRSTGIAPFNPNKIIEKLPSSKQPTMTYTIDNALLDWLKESRSADPYKKVRNKKLNILPGKSVSTDDFKDLTTQLNKTKGGLKKTQKKNISTILPVNSGSLQHLSLPLKCPESLSKLCTTILNTHLDQPVQNAEATNVHRFCEILRTDKANVPFIYKTPECLQSNEPKIIINSDVTIHPALPHTFQQNAQKKLQIKNKMATLSSQAALDIKLFPRKKETKQRSVTEEVTREINKYKPKDKTTRRKLELKNSVKEKNMRKKRRKKRLSSDSSLTSSNSAIELCTEDSEYENMEDYIAACIQDEQENIEPNIPYGISNIEYFTAQNSKLSINSWVLTKFAAKKSIKHYIGKVTSIKNQIPEVKFVRKVKTSKSYRGSVFTYPTVDDTCTMNHIEDVISVLPEPNISRRGHIIFDIDLSTYNVQ